MAITTRCTCSCDTDVQRISDCTERASGTGVGDRGSEKVLRGNCISAES